jgi:hypothetical protein
MDWSRYQGMWHVLLMLCTYVFVIGFLLWVSQGVVSTAHLSAIQRHLRDASHGDGVTSLSTAEHVTLEAADLLDAAQRTRPSVTADEWQFYARVYHNFLLSSRAAEFPAASAAEEKGKQRATFK